MTDEITYNTQMATAVTDTVDDVVASMGLPITVAFEQPSADVGTLPRLMVYPTASETTVREYVDGGTVRAFSFRLMLRVSMLDQRDALDACDTLTEIADTIADDPRVFAAHDIAVWSPPSKMRTSLVTCLGTTAQFADWICDFTLEYKS